MIEMALHETTVGALCRLSVRLLPRPQDVPDAFVDRMLAVIRQTPRHTDLLLTKRAKRLPAFFANRPVPANVGLGVTVEDRRYGLPRLDYLRQVPARVRPPRRTDGPLDDGITAWFAMQWLSN